MTTPMRRQYLEIKRQFPDTILFFRLGDFYETFDRDAEIVAEVCNVVLTSRPVGKDQRVPLAGVPYHSVEPHIAKLIAAGYKVAVAEQAGNTPPAGEKLVERIVRRVVTAGTVVEPALLEEGRNNYLVAVAWERGGAASTVAQPAAIGLAYADITTGEFAVTQWEGAEAERLLAEELARLQPAEILVREEKREGKGWKEGKEGKGWKEGKEEEAVRPSFASFPSFPAFPSSPSFPAFPFAPSAALTALPAWQFELETARRALLDQFGVESLAAFGCEHLPLAVQAAGAVAQYLRQTQRGALPHLTGLRTYSTSEFMTLDEATRRNLELTATIRSGSKKGSLLEVLDATRTPQGSRLLRRWLSQPLLDLRQLQARQDAVQRWHDDPLARGELRTLLRQIGDVERWTNRAAQGIARPHDLVGLRQALALAPEIERIADQPLGAQCADVLQVLTAAIADEPPASLDKGGVIRKGFSAELDGIEVAAADAKRWVAGLERVERERTGIKSLKVGFNKVFGYYIEVTTANSHLVPDTYLRKQTLVNAERYITPELKEYESLILHAEERQLELEGEIYRQVLDQVAAAAPRLLRLAHAVAEMDVCAALAEVAANNRYVRPELADDGIVEIGAGRHPVVEQTLRGERFQPNDVRLSPEETILIITGPNMSGKSTYLRQVALITLMAQIGSFVPADRAYIGLVDRIFTRIGAQDEIHAGQSTFMVEMVEAANILHHATNRSLIIFDELGRGTSTYDGLSIAWAVVEYIHNHPRLRAKTLFATHYHELTELAERLPHVVNYNVAVAEEGDTVVFLHKIVPGAADKSYGIHVAQLAGLPKPVIHRAEEILAELEAQGNRPAGLLDEEPLQPIQLSLFGGPDPAVEALKALDINVLSPLEALNKLYELQKLAVSKR